MKLEFRTKRTFIEKPNAIVKSIRGANQDPKTKEWYCGDGDVADFTEARGKQLRKMCPTEVSLWGSDAESAPAPKKAKNATQKKVNTANVPADLA
jgi:hypothetical protein